MNPNISPDQLLSSNVVLERVAEDEPLLVQLAAAFAGRLLADLGATVLRVAQDNDRLCQLKSAAQETVGESSVLATFLYRDKQLITTEQAESLLAGSTRPQLVMNAGYDESDCTGVIPVVSVAAVAADNELAQAPVSELGIQGLVGLTDLFGEPEEQPLMMGGHQTAYTTGYAVFCAALAALTNLKLQGEVDTAQVNSVDALAWVNWKGVAAGALGFPVARGGKGAEAPVVKCADGYFAFMHMPNNWNDVCAEINDPRLQDEQFAKAGRRAKNARALNEIIAEWAADKPWLYLYDFCQRSAIPGGPVLRGAELLDDPLYNHREYFARVEHQSESVTRDISVPGLPLTVEGVEEGEATNGQNSAVPRYSDNTPSKLPLSGKLVLDLGIFTAGSVTSTLLADLGATVIKVESESYSDPFRLWPGIKGDSPLFTFNNRNKLGLNLDLKTEEGKARFLKLVAQADVVVENFRRGVLARLGIDYPVLKEANPNIVLASISGQGAAGPGSGHVSFGSTLEAIGGVAALTGYPGDTCYISGRNLNYPDQIVCLYGAGAVMAALLKAQESGCGMHIDVSQREVTTLAVGEVVAAASLLGSNEDFPGNGDINAYLQDIYRVEDGWLCVTVADQSQATVLSAMLGCDIAELNDKLTEWLAASNSEALLPALRGIGVAAFKANTGAEASELAVIKTGSAFATTGAGKMVKGFPFQFVNSPMRIYEESPSMGEHTQEILSILQS